MEFMTCNMKLKQKEESDQNRMKIIKKPFLNF